jgi:hypothetical protein
MALTSLLDWRRRFEMGRSFLAPTLPHQLIAVRTLCT